MPARPPLSKLYILAGILVAVTGTIRFFAARRRKSSDVDHVSENVLNRIRTEYR
jgi:hypothetical protein